METFPRNFAKIDLLTMQMHQRFFRFREKGHYDNTALKKKAKKENKLQTKRGA